MVSEKPSKIGKKGNKRISTQKGQGVGIMKKQRITGTQNTIGAQGGKDNTPVDDANTTAVVSVEGSVQSMVGKEDMERLFTKIELLEASFQKTVQKLENLEKKVGNLEQKVPRDVTYVKTSAAKSDLTAGTDVGFNDHLTKVIRAFVREKFFKVVKFVTDANAEAIVKQAMHENRIHPMEGQTEGAFLQQCKQIVKTTFNCLRGHMQSQARKNFLSKIGCFESAVVLTMSYRFLTSQPFPFVPGTRKRNGTNKLPTGFPGTVKVHFDKKKSPMVKLHEDYRRYEYGHGDEDFLWFVENVLSAQNASKTKFAQRKSTKTVSEIFSVADEAFGLVVLLNELKCWEMDWKKQEREKQRNAANEPVEVSKLFFKRKSGKKKPWEDLSMMVHRKLCVQVTKRGEEEVSKIWEAAYKDSRAPKICDTDNLNKNQTYHLDNTDGQNTLTDTTPSWLN